MVRIILIGYMGAGKTTIGRQLAKELGVSFYDLDWYIESRRHKTVAQLFAEEGEEAFRRIEHNMLHEVAEFEDVVISCGGGTPCFFDNIDYMNGQGQVVYLKATPEVLMQHLQMARTERPLLKGKTPTELKAFIEEQLHAREPYYSKARYVFDVSLMDNFEKIKTTIAQLRHLLGLLAILLLVSCARMGSPDGGWYDETPPHIVSSTPQDRGVNVKAKKIAISFNEFIKIDDPQNKVIISPPQLEQPEIKTTGKRIVVELKDTLKDSTTYTVDFSDAITDNNEGNAMGNYTFTFSTGNVIDTLQVSGYCLNAENLEPIKGMLVGLYPYDAPDSIFRKEPMVRISRTNSSGMFTIKGVAPGQYRTMALQDADGDYLLSQKSETYGFSRTLVEPSCKPDTRPDTIWRDSLHIQDIKQVGFTHFLPDDIALLCFAEPMTDRVLLKTERNEPNKIGVFFTYGNDTLPRVRGLNFDSEGAFVLEPSLKKDTLIYWIADTALVNKDTLEMELTYLMTDTLGQLVEQTDTITALAKVSYEKRTKEKMKEIEKWQKEQEKKKKKGERYDSIMPQKPLEVRVSVGGSMDPNQRLYLETKEPLAVCDTAAVHLYQQIDSLWYNCPHELVQVAPRRYEVVADWQPEMVLSLETDSAAFVNIYGVCSDKTKAGIKIKGKDAYATLTVELSGTPQGLGKDSMVVVLVDGSDKTVRKEKANAEGKAHFIYLKPGKYYLKAFADMNGNGVWDTGCYDEDRQAEPVFYYGEEIDCKQKWDVKRQWNVSATPIFRQKPAKITKQKAEGTRKQKSRNLERAKQLGKEYLQ